MKVHICSKYTKTHIYSAYAFIDKGVVVRAECLCEEKTSTKYMGYLIGLKKALHAIEKGYVKDEQFDFICDSADLMRWFESGDLYIVPKKYRAIFSDILTLCVGCMSKITFTLAQGINYAKSYATPEYYDKQYDNQTQGVSALELFADM